MKRVLFVCTGNIFNYPNINKLSSYGWTLR